MIACMFFSTGLWRYFNHDFADYMHGRRQIVGEAKIATHAITPYLCDRRTVWFNRSI